MRNNIFGYIFIFFIICIICFAIYKVKVKDAKNNDESGNTQSISNTEKGTELTLAITGLDTINPIITNNKDVQDIDKIIFEPLIEVTEDFNLEYKLATECAKTADNNYIVKLKQNVKWSDGSKFKSDDVKYTIDRLKENGSLVYAQNISYIKEVDIIDDYTLKIILSEDISNFEYYLNFPILSSAYYADTDFWNTDKNKNPTTTGEFKISEVNNNTLVLEKNTNWWNKNQTSTIEKITINLYSTVAEMYNAFKMGSIDFITTENESYQNYIGTIGYSAEEVEGRDFVFLALNTKSGILSDANIRKALRDSIGKDQVKNIYGNMYSETNFPLIKQSYLVSEQDENFYNIDECNNLITSSGWNMVNGAYQKIENYRANLLELNLVVRAADSKRCSAAENIKTQLANVGIIIDIIYASDNQYNSYLNNMNYDMMLCDINQSIAPDLSTYFGNGNLANYNNTEVSEIMSSLKNITDQNELKNKYQRLYEIYNEEVPYIGLVRNKILAIQNNDLVGEIKANWSNFFYNINEWYTIKD